MIKINLKNNIAGGRLSLTNAYVKSVAEKLLADFCPAALETPQPIDVDRLITDYFGFDLLYELLSHNLSVLGMTNFADGALTLYDPSTKRTKKEKVKKNTVIIDSRMTEGTNKVRHSYTAAHECGHIIFDNLDVRQAREDSRQLMMECAEEFDPVAYHAALPKNQKDDAKWIEHYCDHFASCLILPDKTVKMAAAQILRKHKFASPFIYPHTEAEQKFAVDVLAGGVAAIFETSKEAAMYKLFDLKIIRGGREFYERMKAKYGN